MLHESGDHTQPWRMADGGCCEGPTSENFGGTMRIASLAMALGVIGFCIPAHAGLIGSTVDIRHLFPDQATVNIEGGPATVSGAVEYPLFFSFSVDITDTQILARWPGPGNLGFSATAFNGFEYLFSGVTITGATVNGSSTFLGTPTINIVGNNIFVNYAGLQTGNSPTVSIIDVTTSSDTGTPASAPEPGTLALLGAGLLGLSFRYKRRSA